MDIISVSGRVKSLEKRFLNSEEAEKLVNSRSFSEFTGMLEGSFYKIPQAISARDEMEEFFERETAKLTAEMQKYLPSNLYSYFTLRYEYHNISILSSGLSDSAEFSSPHSPVDFSVLKEAFDTGNHKNIPSFLRRPLSELSRKREESAESVSFFLRKSYYTVSSAMLAESRSSLLDYYHSIEVDFANIAIMLRLFSGGKNSPKTGNFISGGNVKKERFQGKETLWEFLKKEYRKIETPIDEINYDMERYRALSRYASRGRAIPFGIDPVFFYFVGRQVELENVKRLAMAKFYNIPPKTLSEWGVSCYQYV